VAPLLSYMIPYQTIYAIESALEKADHYGSKLPRAILEMDGMSGQKFRHFLNHMFQLLGEQKLINYLEIGSWRGSTFCSSIYGNRINAQSIDNHSEFNQITMAGSVNTASEDLKTNINNTVMWSPASEMGAKLLIADCFAINPLEFGIKYDVYFYDGEHSHASQYKAFTHYAGALADTFIAIVDDCEKDLPNPPREATQQAFEDLGWTVIKDWYRKEGDSNVMTEAKAGWWNGVYVALVQKTAK
jgi:hypothetical protein